MASLNPALRPSPGQLNAPSTTIDPNGARPGRIFQWNIGLQREVVRNVLVEAAYVGNRGNWLTNNCLAREKDSTYTIGRSSLADTFQALRVVKQRADKWGLNPDRIGVMGFSAGGELAALAAVREAPIEDGVSARPAFQVLVYPAIPRNMELCKAMPPAFLVCGENDRQNISQGLPELYLAMKKAGISAELHVYVKVGHGFGSRPTSKGRCSSGFRGSMNAWTCRGSLPSLDERQTA